MQRPWLSLAAIVLACVAAAIVWGLVLAMPSTARIDWRKELEEASFDYDEAGTAINVCQSLMAYTEFVGEDDPALTREYLALVGRACRWAKGKQEDANLRCRDAQRKIDARY